MLVLTRKTSEAIQIGDSIRIMVVAIQGDRVRIGIEAPRDQIISRTELLEQEPARQSPEPTAPAA